MHTTLQTIRRYPERSSHICDSHFRAFLLITQAPVAVKIISDDTELPKQTCAKRGFGHQVSEFGRKGFVFPVL